MSYIQEQLNGLSTERRTYHCTQCKKSYLWSEVDLRWMQFFTNVMPCNHTFDMLSLQSWSERGLKLQIEVEAMLANVQRRLGSYWQM